MPLYDFRCSSCGTRRELFGAYADIGELELICTACGGAMTRAPSAVGALVFRAPAPAAAAPDASPGNEALAPVKPCGHRHACRCGIKLTRPNPFRQQIRLADAGQADTDTDTR